MNIEKKKNGLVKQGVATSTSGPTGSLEPLLGQLSRGTNPQSLGLDGPSEHDTYIRAVHGRFESIFPKLVTAR